MFQEESSGGMSQGAAQNSQAIVLWLKMVAIINLASQALSLLSILIMMSSPAMRGMAGSQFVSFLVSGTISIVMAIKMLQQAAAIERYGQTRQLRDYESSLTHESVYWMIAGIVAILFTVIMVFLTFAFISFGDQLMRELGRGFRF